MDGQAVFKPEPAAGEPMKPMIPTCCQCGSKVVWVSSNSIVWDNEDQRWKMDNDFDAMLFCENCDGIDKFVWIPSEVEKHGSTDRKFNLTLDVIKSRIPDAKSKAILASAVRMHVGWEMDNELHCVELEDGSRIIVGTSHGGFVQVDRKELKTIRAEHLSSFAQIDRLLSLMPEEEPDGP